MQRMMGGMASMRMGKDVIQGLVNPAMNFQKAMANVSTMVDDTAGEMGYLTKEVRKMSKELPQTQDDLGAGLYQVLSAGITDSAEAIRVLGISAKAATAGITTTAVSVDAITTILNAYGKEASEAQHISDLMFQTVKGGKLTYEQLATSLGRVTSTAATAGVGIEQLLAAYATMTKKGISAEETATALNQTMLAYIKPTDQAKQAAADLGIELSAQSLQAKGLFGSMMELANAEGANAEALAEMFPNVRALKGSLALTAGEAETFSKDLESMAKASEGAGASQIAFDKIMNTSASQMQIYENRVNDLKISMGENLLPTVMGVLDPMMKMLELYNELPGPLQEVIPLIIATGAAIMILHGASLLLAANPLTLAIIGIVVAVYLLKKAVDEGYISVDDFKTIGEGLVDVFKFLYKGIRLFNPGIMIMEKLISKGVFSTENLTTAFKIFFPFVLPALALTKDLMGLITDNTDKFTDAVNGLVDPFKTLYGWIKKALDTYEDLMESGAGKFASGVSDVAGGITGAFHPISRSMEVPQTGKYMLQKGETVSPGTSAAGNAPSGSGMNGQTQIIINNPVIRRDSDIPRIVNEVERRIARKINAR